MAAMPVSTPDWANAPAFPSPVLPSEPMTPAASAPMGYDDGLTFGQQQNMPASMDAGMFMAPSTQRRAVGRTVSR